MSTVRTDVKVDDSDRCLPGRDAPCPPKAEQADAETPAGETQDRKEPENVPKQTSKQIPSAVIEPPVGELDTATRRRITMRREEDRAKTR